MATRVYALYQNSRLVLIFLITLWLGVITVGCVRVTSTHYYVSDD